MGRRIWMVAAGILALALSGAPAFAAVPEYFKLPAGFNAGRGIAPAPDGTVWFVASSVGGTPAPSIGRLIGAQAAAGTTNGMATFPTPTQAGTGCCANAVTSVAFDAASNRLWFVQNDGIVGFADPAAVSPGTSNGMTDKLLSTQTTSPNLYHPVLWDIAIGAGGLAWFTEQSASNLPPYPGDRIASINAVMNVTELENIAYRASDTMLNGLRFDAQPEGIATAPTGKPWFAEAAAGNPGYRIATAHDSGYDEYLIEPCSGSPCSGSNVGTGPTDVAVAHDGSIWFTNELKNEVGRLDPVGHTFTNYSLTHIDAGLAAGQPRAISVAPDGTLWLAENGGFTNASANAIVRIVPSQPTPSATVYHLGAGRYPLAVAPDTKGNVWFSLTTDVAPGLIGRLAGVVGSAPGGGGGGGGGGGKPVTPASVGVARIGTPTTSGTKMTVNQACVGPPKDPCSLVFLISSHEYVAGFSGSKASAARAKKHPKPKPVILGKKYVTLHGGQHKQVTIKLNAKGRKLLAHSPTGKLKVYLSVTQKGADGKPPKRVKRVKVTFKRAKRR